MTITNHTKLIQILADKVIENVDLRQYPQSHCLLDDIEKQVRLAHRHIDYLQDVTDSEPIPPGGS